jgi:DUF4097 and DUF4098 domain-containing protein YvlB
MNAYFKIVVFIILPLCFARPAKCQTTRQVTMQLTDPLKPGKLDIELFFGSIKVMGYPGKEVIITSTGPYYPNNANSPHQQNKALVKDTSTMIEVSQKNNLVKMVLEKPRTTNLVVKVPENFSLVLKIQTGGDIIVENVNGDHEISVISGNITMAGVSGSLLANTKNGNITVGFNSVKPGTPLAFSNVMGIIDVSFPGTLKANARFQTEFGEIHSDFSIINEPSDIKPAAVVNKKANGKINGGGPELFIKTVGGNIFVRKKK